MVHVVEGVAALIVIVSMIDGWRRGLLLKLYGLVKLIAVIILTVVLTPLIYKVMPLESGFREGVSALLALFVAVIVMILVSRALKLIDNIPVLNTVNRLCGVVIGLVFGILIVWILFVLISTLTEIDWCRKITEYVYQSPILKLIVRWNPADLLK